MLSPIDAGNSENELTSEGSEETDTLVIEDSDAGTLVLSSAETGSIRDRVKSRSLTKDIAYSMEVSGFETITIAEIDQVTFDGPLNIGSGTLNLNATLPVNLPLLTTLSGGTLSSTSALALTAGESIVASGTIAGRVAGEVGSLVQATGDLAIGDRSSAAGVELRGDLQVGGNRDELLDKNEAVLGCDLLTWQRYRKPFHSR